MVSRTAVLVACGVLTAGRRCAEAAPNPTQRPRRSSTTDNGVPLFKVTVVGRTTPAVNYRPRSGDTKIRFRRHPLMPMAHGSAVVSGEKGYMHIDARFDKLAPPTQFGAEYLTYVLWAITPEGRATNLGEVQRDDEDARVKVTTELQAFGSILTAEPYFAVTQPSDVVVMENVAARQHEGARGTIQAKYELLKRGSYLMNQDCRRLASSRSSRRAARSRRGAATPWSWRGSRARTATRPTRFNKPRRSERRRVGARKAAGQPNDIMQPARQAAQTAEDARLVGLQRQEEEFQAEQRRVRAAREQDALAARPAEADQRRQAELNAQAAARSGRTRSARRPRPTRRAQADAARGRPRANASGRGGTRGRRSRTQRPRRRCAKPSRGVACARPAAQSERERASCASACASS
jgi:hypothetical protein